MCLPTWPRCEWWACRSRLMILRPEGRSLAEIKPLMDQVKIFTTHRELTRTKEGVASSANERSKTPLTMTAETVLCPRAIRRSAEADTTTRTAPRRSDHAALCSASHSGTVAPRVKNLSLRAGSAVQCQVSARATRRCVCLALPVRVACAQEKG